MVESVLHGRPDDHPLPIVVYLDNIAMYWDTQEEVLEDTLEAVKGLAATGFMLNLHKSQLVQAAVHRFSGIFGPRAAFGHPTSPSSPSLMEKTDGKLAWFNWASLYGLLNFYREYIPAFAKLVEPLLPTLGPGHPNPWMPEAWECIHEVAVVSYYCACTG